MKAIQLEGKWFVVRTVWLRRVQTRVSQRPSRGKPPSYKTVKTLSYFAAFADGRPEFTTKFIHAHGFESLERLKTFFGEVKVIQPEDLTGLPERLMM